MTPKSATTLTNDNGYNGHPTLNSPKISETSAFQKSFFSTTPTNNNSTNQKLKSAPNGLNGSVKNPVRFFKCLMLANFEWLIFFCCFRQDQIQVFM